MGVGFVLPEFSASVSVVTIFAKFYLDYSGGFPFMLFMSFPLFWGINSVLAYLGFSCWCSSVLDIGSRIAC